MWQEIKKEVINLAITTSLTKIVPQSRGMVQTAVTGIGFDQVLKVVDGFVGSPMQKFGVSVPIVGRLSLVDFVNYMVHNGGKIMPSKSATKGITAVVSAKLVQTGFNVRTMVSPTNANNTQSGGGI